VSKGYKAPADLPGAVIHPSFDRWITIAESNMRLARKWQTRVADVPLGELKKLAREEGIAQATEYSRRMGVSLADFGGKSPNAPLIMSGAAPALYHPGVWSKVFMIQRFAERHDALAIDVVVDTERFSDISVQVPRVVEGKAVGRDAITLANSSFAEYFAAIPVPERGAVKDYCAAIDHALSKLPDCAWRLNFQAFSRALIDSVTLTNNIGELITFARRRYETSSGNDYLELPVSMWPKTRSFRLYAADIIVSANRYLAVYNEELSAYRSTHKVRSAAQPLPDLRRSGDLLELPFWMLKNGRRLSVFSRNTGSRVQLYAENELAADLPCDIKEIERFLLSVSFAPKALALTIFARIFLADIFVHGTGGNRYDQIADKLIRRYYGVEPPGFVVVSVDADSPLAAESDTLAKQLSQAKAALKRFRHHPETAIQIDCGVSAGAYHTLCELVEKKAGLVDAIQRAGARKVILGKALKEVNLELVTRLKPVEVSLERRVNELEALLNHLIVLSDRNYPYCFFSPRLFKETLW